MTSKNIDRKENFNQVCVVGKEKINDFEKYMFDKFKIRIQYLEEILTLPEKNESDTGNRNDLFFAIHDEDVSKFAVPRLQYEIKWIEDVLSKSNYKNKIYPDRVKGYKAW